MGEKMSWYKSRFDCVARPILQPTSIMSRTSLMTTLGLLAVVLLSVSLIQPISARPANAVKPVEKSNPVEKGNPLDKAASLLPLKLTSNPALTGPGSIGQFVTVKRSDLDSIKTKLAGQEVLIPADKNKELIQDGNQDPDKPVTIWLSIDQLTKIELGSTFETVLSYKRGLLKNRPL